VNRCSWLFWIPVFFLLSACQDEVQPKLDLAGHWIVDHGFHHGCQVGATFEQDRVLILTFFSLQEGACEPERYGIEGGVLSLDIDSKRDYFNDEGSLTAELQVSLHWPRYLSGTLQITETSAGMTGLIVSTSHDPEDLLAPLLERVYGLTRVPRDWFGALQGRWGCDPTETGGTCEVIEFLTDTLGRFRMYEGCNEHLECDRQTESSEFIYALRNVETLSQGAYRIDLATFGPGSGDGPPARPATLMLTQDYLEMSESRFYPLMSLPLVTGQ
jgi:hypothetical protein